MPLGMFARIFSLKITSRSIRRAASAWRRATLPASQAATAVTTMSHKAGIVILSNKSRTGRYAAALGCSTTVIQPVLSTVVNE